VAWWRETLDPANGPARPAFRRRVVLVQALALLTGCRIGELLLAKQSLVQGHWLLLHPQAVKTRQPRLLYVTRQALGIAAALRAWTRDGQRLLFEPRDAADVFAGWKFSSSYWHKRVKTCLRPPANDEERAATRRLMIKRHQGLRKVCSTWLDLRDPVAERAQLGHGGGDVVSQCYRGLWQRIPRAMDRKPLRLPELEGLTWPAPIDAGRAVPDRLYAEFQRMVEE
jgi:integrase